MCVCVYHGYVCVYVYVCECVLNIVHVSCVPTVPTGTCHTGGAPAGAAGPWETRRGARTEELRLKIGGSIVP